MRKILFIFPLLLICLMARGGGILKGKVTDANGHGIAGVSVYLKKIDRGTSTDSNGCYFFTGLPVGSYSVKYSHVSYTEQEQKIIIKEGVESILDLIMEARIILTDEVVITATRVEQTIRQVPGRIELIPNKTINALPVLSVDDLMMSVPGVQVSRSYGIFSNKAIVTMRGLGGKEQSRVLVLVDGIPVNKTDGGSVNWNLLNTAFIDRIEIAKGPSSSLYGSNAMGGIIHIITKRPEEKLSGRIGVKGGSYSTFGGNFWLGGREPLAKDNKEKYLYWVLSGFGNYSPGYYTEPNDSIIAADTTTVKSYLREYALTGRLGFNISESQNVEAEVSYYDDWRGSGVKVIEPTGGYTRHSTYLARGRYRATAGIFTIFANVFLQRENYHAMNESFKDYTYKLYDVSSVRNDFGLMLHVSQSLFKNNILTEGIDVRQGSVDAADVYYTSTDKVDNAGKMNFYAVYFQDEYSFFRDRFKLFAGLRFDYARFFDGAFTLEDPTAATSFVAPFVDDAIETDAWQAFSPRISLQYSPLKQFRTYLSWSQGFRPPILDDMCRSGKIRGGFKIANPSLKPETIDNYEWGFSLSMMDKMLINGSVYYSLGHDFMYYVSTGDSVDLGYYPLTPVYIRKNISEVEIYGAELGWSYNILPRINVFLNYSYTHARVLKYEVIDTVANSDLSGKFLADVPMHAASAGFWWYNRILNFSLSANFTGKMYINDRNEYDDTYLFSDTYPSYYTFDAKAGHLFFKHLDVSLNVMNIFNKKYYDSKNQVSPGRMIFGELVYKF